MMNSWNFTGNLGGDAELRFTKSGTEVLQFTVATTAGYGERKQHNLSFYSPRIGNTPEKYSC